VKATGHRRAAFDEVFRTEGIQVIRTPLRAPNANAHAERFVRTLREECLDWLLILGRRHLERVLREYVEHYNRERPHRALGLRAPSPRHRWFRSARDTRPLSADATGSAGSSMSTRGRHERRSPSL
jgi:transposase InsO family protein